MTWDKLEGEWSQIKGAVKEQWGKLTDDDLTAAEGKMDKLRGRIQERYGITAEEAERQLNDFAGRRKHRS